MFVLCRFIARLEEQIHEWKLNTVTLGAPLTKVVATLNLQLLFLLHWTQKCMLKSSQVKFNHQLCGQNGRIAM